MPERRPQATSNTSASSRSNPGVRRNLFHQHLSRRPTTASASSSSETLRFSNDIASREGSESSEIVIRDKNGECEIGDLPMTSLDEEHEGEEGGEGIQEESRDMISFAVGSGWMADICKRAGDRKKLVDAVKLHQRDRNRAPSEPAELLEAVRASLRAKVIALAEDNWMYEAENSHQSR